jgi:hypothetical protein
MKARLTGIALVIFLSMGMVFFLLPSCDTLKDAADVKVKYDLPDTYFTIDSLSQLKAERLLFSQTFTANIDSIVNANTGSLKNANFYLLRLSVVSPEWVTLSWLNSARATITPQGGSPIEVATTTSVNPTARSVEFVIKNLDVASTITGPFILNIYGDLNGPVPAATLHMLLESGVEVVINPL